MTRNTQKVPQAKSVDLIFPSQKIRSKNDSLSDLCALERSASDGERARKKFFNFDAPKPTSSGRFKEDQENYEVEEV